MKTWGFTESDSLDEYLRKALTSKYVPKPFCSVKGTIGGETYEGIELRQPTGKTVLGAKLQVFTNPEKAGVIDDIQNKLKNEVFINNVLMDGPALLKMVESKEVGLAKASSVKHRGKECGPVVIIPPNGRLKSTASASEEIAIPTS